MSFQSICGCLKPVELADLRCGACGLRRLGDDLTPAQLHDLTEVLTAMFASLSERRVFLKRVRGRRRPRDRERRV
jgi:hypothetical protein